MSKNLRQLREITDTVTKPYLKEAYQFPRCDDPALLQRVLKMCGTVLQKQADNTRPT